MEEFGNKLEMNFLFPAFDLSRDVTPKDEPAVDVADSYTAIQDFSEQSESDDDEGDMDPSKEDSLGSEKLREKGALNARERRRHRLAAALAVLRNKIKGLGIVLRKRTRTKVVPLSVTNQVQQLLVA